MRDAEFEDLRPRLFSIAYRMLGTVGEAEDVVQEAFIRWQRSSVEPESTSAYLAKIVTRLCIDYLRSAKVRRETYVGPWLPEPLVQDKAPDVSEQVEQLDSLSMAFMVLLETLTPIERAVFLLREIFDYGYVEIAEVVGRSEDNCRQIAHRAKQHIAARRPRFSPSPEAQEQMTYRFMAACAEGDLDGLMSMLSEDITLWSDGGGKVRAARHPIEGRGKVARFVLGILKKTPEEAEIRVVWTNGQPGIVLYQDGNPTSVLTMDADAEMVRGIHIVVNPDKLRSVEGA